MSVNLDYTYPTEEMAHTITWVLATGTPSTGYGVEKLSNSDPADPYKVDSTTLRLTGDFGAAVAPKLAAIVHHNFAPGLIGVKLEGHTSNVWTSPLFSQSFPAASYYNDDFAVNLSLDLRTSAPSYRYWSLAVTSANTVNLSIGEFLMYSNVRTLDGSFTLSLSPEEEEDHPLIEHPTDADVSLLYELGWKRRTIRGGIIQDTDNAQLVRDWNRATRGRSLPFTVLVTESEASGEEPWYVRFERSTLTRKFTYGSVASTFDLGFAEVSRGLRPTPAAV